jgi:hypothetical protein
MKHGSNYDVADNVVKGLKENSDKKFDEMNKNLDALRFLPPLDANGDRVANEEKVQEHYDEVMMRLRDTHKTVRDMFDITQRNNIRPPDMINEEDVPEFHVELEDIGDEYEIPEDEGENGSEDDHYELNQAQFFPSGDDDVDHEASLGQKSSMLPTIPEESLPEYDSEGNRLMYMGTDGSINTLKGDRLIPVDSQANVKRTWRAKYGSFIPATPLKDEDIAKIKNELQEAEFNTDHLINTHIGGEGLSILNDITATTSAQKKEHMIQSNHTSKELKRLQKEEKEERIEREKKREKDEEGLLRSRIEIESRRNIEQLMAQDEAYANRQTPEKASTEPRISSTLSQLKRRVSTFKERNKKGKTALDQNDDDDDDDDDIQVKTGPENLDVSQIIPPKKLFTSAEKSSKSASEHAKQKVQETPIKSKSKSDVEPSSALKSNKKSNKFFQEYSINYKAKANEYRDIIKDLYGIPSDEITNNLLKWLRERKLDENGNPQQMMYRLLKYESELYDKNNTK